MVYVAEAVGGLVLLALLLYGGRELYRRWKTSVVAETELERLLREGQEKHKKTRKTDR